MKFVTLLALIFTTIYLNEGNILPKLPRAPLTRIHHHDRVLSDHHGPHHRVAHTIAHPRLHSSPGVATHSHIHPPVNHGPKLVHKDSLVKALATRTHPIHSTHGFPKAFAPRVKMPSIIPHHGKPHSRPRHVRVHARNHH